MDMVVCYGQAFPLRDASGKEIIPPSEGRVWDFLNFIHIIKMEYYIQFLYGI